MPATSVSVHLELVGWHSWPAARPPRDYLASLHRHRFHIDVDVPIDADHGVEFHDLADVVRDWWGEESAQHDRGSCESQAGELFTALNVLLGRRPMRVSVGEDGEAWSTVWDTRGP